MYGDSWLTEPIEPVWRAFLDSGKPALMTVFRNNNQWGASNVDFRNGAIRRYDKRHAAPGLHYIDYGLEALDASLIANRIAPAFDLSEVWSGLAEYGLLAGFETARRFYEIGTIPGLRETEAYLIANRASASRNKFTTPPKLSTETRP
jgi:NDP-sugar pyrophosphorylase family protein